MQIMHEIIFKRLQTIWVWEQFLGILSHGLNLRLIIGNQLIMRNEQLLVLLQQTVSLVDSVRIRSIRLIVTIWCYFQIDDAGKQTFHRLLIMLVCQMMLFRHSVMSQIMIKSHELICFNQDRMRMDMILVKTVCSQCKLERELKHWHEVILHILFRLLLCNGQI